MEYHELLAHTSTRSPTFPDKFPFFVGFFRKIRKWCGKEIASFGKKKREATALLFSWRRDVLKSFFLSSRPDLCLHTCLKADDCDSFWPSRLLTKRPLWLVKASTTQWQIWPYCKSSMKVWISSLIEYSTLKYIPEILTFPDNFMFNWWKFPQKAYLMML